MSDNPFTRMRPAISLFLAALAGCTYPDPDLRPAPPRRTAFGEAIPVLKGYPKDRVTVKGDTVAFSHGHSITLALGGLLRISGGGLPLHVHSPEREEAKDPDLSPIDARLAWVVRDRSGAPYSRFQVFVGEVPDGAKRLVASAESDLCQPDFSADGRAIVWTESFEGSPRLWMTDLASLKSTFITEGASPATSPDGQWIAFEYGSPPSLFKVRLDGTDRTRLTEGIDARRPTWSPDSCWIAFGQFDSEGRADDIWAVRSDGSRYLRVTWDPAPEWDPCWAPDGRIYFTTIRNGAQGIWGVAQENKELLK
ncbi:MAG: hypothetical protein FD180_4455 [Planctomycetota bacterium]|nr:MAG: hypothetical protein FD180_4455 [Planctomycetota bacterium]